MKGTALIELRDVHTGKVQTVREDNLVTNIFRDFFTKKPLPAMGSVENNFTPIWQNMLGGLYIFGDTLDEDPDKYYPPSSIEYIGYASKDINTTADTKRGSLNTEESGAVDGGYKFVWDFTTSQANGEIKSLALTHWLAGRCGPGSAFYKELNIGMFGSFSTSSSSTDNGYRNYITRYEGKTTISERLYHCGAHGLNPGEYAVRWIDYENNCFFMVRSANDARHFLIEKYHYPFVSLGITDSLDIARKVDTIEITTETDWHYFTPPTSSSSVPTYYRTAYVDGGTDDPYFWIIQTPADAQSTVGTYTWKYIRVKKSDLTWVEGTWTIAGINWTHMVFSVYRYTQPYCWPQNCVIRNGYLYFANYAKTGFYKMNLSNSTDVTFLQAGFTLALPTSGGTYGNGGAPANIIAFYTPVLIRGYIRGYNFYIDGNDNIVQTPEGAGHYLNVPLAPGAKLHCTTAYKCFRIAFGRIDTGQGYSYYAAIPVVDINYLATINNLAVPVTKTASQTMKITYTITEDVA